MNCHQARNRIMAVEDSANLPAELRPADVDEAYAAQAEFHRLAIPVHGPIGGWKIATTTKVMQELMGIGHPCAGAIFESRIHLSPARLHSADYVSLKIEFELAFRLALGDAVSIARIDIRQPDLGIRLYDELLREMFHWPFILHRTSTGYTGPPLATLRAC